MCYYLMLANRSQPLNPDYIPKDRTQPGIRFQAPPECPKRLLRAQAAIAGEELFQKAYQQGLSLWGVSGFRSFTRQKEIYQNSRSSYVAPPGCSEHQTGLALDVSCPAAEFDLTEDFAKTREYEFLENYGPIYGFILRYPRGKENITGYAWEPWHIRFVTKTPALYLSFSNITLEEYHQL